MQALRGERAILATVRQQLYAERQASPEGRPASGKVSLVADDAISALVGSPNREMEQDICAIHQPPTRDRPFIQVKFFLALVDVMLCQERAHEVRVVFVTLTLSLVACCSFERITAAQLETAGATCTA